MANSINLLTRKLHRWGALIFGAPLLLVIISGLLLQAKKQLTWVQPPTQKGATSNQTPSLDWSKILNRAREIPEAQVTGWEDIDRLDIQPSKGMVKVRCNNRWEIQIDLQTGDTLSSTYRRSDLIESLHDGSFFSQGVKLGIFLPNGIVLLVLWFTGAWLWYLPYWSRRKRRASGSTR